jgi:hypothetical protein
LGDGRFAHDRQFLSMSTVYVVNLSTLGGVASTSVAGEWRYRLMIIGIRKIGVFILTLIIIMY